MNGLLALWGFVDDTTFLTKAGHVGRGVPRCGAWTTRACPTRSARRWRTGSRPRLRLLDEHCRVYQYLLKRTVETVRRRAVPAADRERGDPAPSGLPERPPRRAVRPLALPGPALRGPARGAAQHASCAASGRPPPGLAGMALDRHAPCSSLEVRAGSGDRDAPPQGAGIRGADRRLRTGASREAGRLPLLP